MKIVIKNDKLNFINFTYSADLAQNYSYNLIDLFDFLQYKILQLNFFFIYKKAILIYIGQTPAATSRIYIDVYLVKKFKFFD